MVVIPDIKTRVSRQVVYVEEIPGFWEEPARAKCEHKAETHWEHLKPYVLENSTRL